MSPKWSQNTRLMQVHRMGSLDPRSSAPFYSCTPRWTDPLCSALPVSSRALVGHAPSQASRPLSHRDTRRQPMNTNVLSLSLSLSLFLFGARSVAVTFANGMTKLTLSLSRRMEFRDAFSQEITTHDSTQHNVNLPHCKTSSTCLFICLFFDGPISGPSSCTQNAGAERC